jgi:hypothetical protein
MTIAVSGQVYNWGASKMLVTCTGANSLMEINLEGTGFVPVEGGSVVAGVILADTSFSADLKRCDVRFTGAGVVSFS